METGDKMSVAILTDTNSGINEAKAQELGIHLIPMPVLIEQQTFFEGSNLTNDMLCSILKSGAKVSTSQPALGDVISKWEKLLEKGYDEIIYIPMSGGLSSSCSCAKAAAEDYEGKVYVVDNHRISVTQKASVLKAKHMADEGSKASAIAEYLEKDKYNSSIYVSVENLDYLKKGGRITPAVAAIASILKIKPVLSIQGEKLDSYAKIRGNMYRCEMKMLDAIKADIEKRFNQPNVALLHVGTAGFGITKDQADKWLEMTKEAFPNADVYYDELPASIGTHTGPGTVGIGLSVDYE